MKTGSQVAFAQHVAMAITPGLGITSGSKSCLMSVQFVKYDLILSSSRSYVRKTYLQSCIPALNFAVLLKGLEDTPSPLLIPKKKQKRMLLGSEILGSLNFIQASMLSSLHVGCCKLQSSLPDVSSESPHVEEGLQNFRPQLIAHSASLHVICGMEPHHFRCQACRL